MSDVRVRDVSEANIEDVFRVCSYSKLNDPLQREGMELRRQWIRGMIEEYGTCIKIAYLGEKPVAHLMFYPEVAAKFLLAPRKGVVLLRCVYNPFEEARGKGASTALVKCLIEECGGDPSYLKGVSCSFIASEPFNTGEGTPMEKFYAASGFTRRGNEMFYEVKGKYLAPKKPVFDKSHANRNAATIIYDPTCEWSYVHAVQVRDALKDMYSDLPVWLINQWQKPEASLSLANKWFIVKGTPIESSLRQQEAFKAEVRRAVEDSR